MQFQNPQCFEDWNFIRNHLEVKLTLQLVGIFLHFPTEISLCVIWAMVPQTPPGGITVQSAPTTHCLSKTQKCIWPLGTWTRYRGL